MNSIARDNTVAVDAGGRRAPFGGALIRPSRVDAAIAAQTDRRAAFSPVVVAIGAFALTLAVGLGAAHGFRPTPRLFGAFAMLASFTGALFLIYRDIRNDQRIAYIFGALGVTSAIAYVNAALALIVMTTPLPLQDEILMRASAAIGVDYAALMTAVARHPPIGDILWTAYDSCGPLDYAALLFLAWTRQFVRLRRLVVLNALLLTVCVTVASFAPAMGYAIVAPLPVDVTAALPPGAAVYSKEIVELYRSGALRTLDPNYFNGVITFPSYHTVMALLVVYACWATPILRWIALALTALMLLSIIPIGGHYVWDMVAAVALFAAALPLARRCEPGADREIVDDRETQID
jgi:hypothetical protein